MAVARGELVRVIAGWHETELACDHDETEEMLRDIMDFASMNFDRIYDQVDRLCEFTEHRVPVATQRQIFQGASAKWGDL